MPLLRVASVLGWFMLAALVLFTRAFWRK